MRLPIGNIGPARMKSSEALENLNRGLQEQYSSAREDSGSLGPSTVATDEELMTPSTETSRVIFDDRVAELAVPVKYTGNRHAHALVDTSIESGKKCRTGGHTEAVAIWKQDATSPLIVRLPSSKVKAKERQANGTGTATGEGTSPVELTWSSLRAVGQWARNGESLVDVRGSKFSLQGLGYGIRMSRKARTKEIRAWHRSLYTGLTSRYV